MKPVIMETSGLCVNYGRVEAIHNVNIRIREGEIVTVIGPNGAGKTTLLSALMGLLPARGEVKYQGHSTLGAMSVDALVAKGLVLVPEKRVPHFKPGKALREAVDQRTAELETSL